MYFTFSLYSLAVERKVKFMTEASEAIYWNDLEGTVLLESKIESGKIMPCFRSNKDF